MLLGSYEAELHPIIERLRERDYAHIANIGAGGGYYAVGFARLRPNARVYAFEIDSVRRAQCRDMALANGVADRITILGECTVQWLKTLPAEHSLVICDCEGCELDILQPRLAPPLVTCDLIVEIHDCWNPSISAAILERFASSHDVTWIPIAERDRLAYPALDAVDPRDHPAALHEGRAAGNWWLFMQARHVRAPERFQSRRP